MLPRIVPPVDIPRQPAEIDTGRSVGVQRDQAARLAARLHQDPTPRTYQFVERWGHGTPIGPPSVIAWLTPDMAQHIYDAMCQRNAGNLAAGRYSVEVTVVEEP